MENKKKDYTNGEITVVWKSELCIHCGNCSHGLSSVFKPSQRPWINMSGADSESIKKQVTECPSGALSYYLNKKEE